MEKITEFMRIVNAADAVRERTRGTAPEIGLVLGSGLGQLAGAVEDAVVIPYGEIPGFAVSTAPDHAGQLVYGSLVGKRVVCMQGRLHRYEGHAYADIVRPIRVMKALGVHTLVLTNAAGGIDLSFAPGDIMLIEDHINFMGDNPLIGENDERLGPRFPDMTYAYAPGLRQAAQAAAKRLGIYLRSGVYLGCTGPSFETPAEIRAFRALGASAVGMSTVPEVIAAAHCGMQTLAFSLITNMAAGVLAQPINGEEVVEIGRKRASDLCLLIKETICALEQGEAR